MKIEVYYDDTVKKGEIISNIIGDRGFADVVVKKKTLEKYYTEALYSIFSDMHWYKISSLYEYKKIQKDLESSLDSDIRIIHCFSNYVFSDLKSAQLSFKKIEFIEEPFLLLDGNRIVAMLFPNTTSYLKYCKRVNSGMKPWDAAKTISEKTNIAGMKNIGAITNFIQCITGSFDSRYFNSIVSHDYTLTKRSANKRKIKAEYTFYHLLPDDMKVWFVMPFDYQETEKDASYTMERLHMTDLAIKWVHGSIDYEEFNEILDNYFYFFTHRHAKDCSKEQYQKTAAELYIDKVQKRVEQLKNCKEYKTIEKILSLKEQYNLDYLVEKYFKLKDCIESKVNLPCETVIGHGDPCFSNTMYNKSTKTLKFIDPKGALQEEELWTNPYYDIAKLSHSICGKYDFFNSGLFDIHITDKFELDLEIAFDNREYIKLFKNKVEQYGFNYCLVRLYETSLFLSMLPLHIDDAHKVLGFILNVKQILEEIE